MTVVIPAHRDCNKQWLGQARNSFPTGQKILIAWNEGELAEARNEAVRSCETEFVYLFDADDVALPGLLEHLRGWAWDADVVYPGMVLRSEDLSEVVGVHDADPFCANRLLKGNYITGSSLYRRSKFLEVGGFRDYPILEDWDLMVRLWRAGARIKPCPQAQFVYRQVPGSRNKVEDVARVREEMRRKIVGEPERLLATFYHQATPAQTYLRCQLPARWLPGQARPSEIPRLVANKDDPQDADDLDVVFPDHEGAAVFQFAGDKQRAVTALLMQADGVRVLVETDDNYLIHPGKQILGRSGWGVGIGDAPSTRDGHRYVVSQANGVIVTTETLANAYRKFNPNVYVCPNTVDPEDWQTPDKPDDGIFRIGWSAANAHDRDIPLITSAFRWASRQKDVQVFVHGLRPNLKDRWDFKWGWLPWDNDLAGYRTRMQFFDVMVAPIVPTPFALGRSDVKALEISMGGALPVLSDVAPYKHWRDGETCWKANSASEFRKRIEWCVSHRDEVKQMAEEARAYTLRERTTEAQIGLWREAVKG